MIREDQKMKPLSESLRDLAARVQQFEESSAATREKNVAALQAKKEDLAATFGHEGKEIEKTAAELREAAQSWWADTREALERQIGLVRADFEKWQTELKTQHATGPAAESKPAVESKPVEPAGKS
ncbi:hypothetical protein NS14008_32160 [Nocardia seriolae]|nr:hypothetical protein NS14008_32160 [Nocardia seriolae]PSK27013.1 hypothetical protein C6575_34160 [Nocardia seriolae]RLP33449.1 hypothetical protein D6158_02715 [Nocardia seriolae]